MARSRYWKLTTDEVEKLTYDESKLLNWDMKCIREPEEKAEFVGVFMYRNGTPYDYDSIKGISFFYNNFSRDELPTVTKFLKNKFGGEELEKGERIILKGSKEIFSGKDIAGLAKEMEEKFKTTTTITLEFDDYDQEKMKEAGLPVAKLLPIPGK